MKHPILAMIGLAAACGGTGEQPDAGPPDAAVGSEPDDGARSGSRLKLIWTDWGGTRVGGVSARDVVLDADCRSLRWDDGAMRCTPDPYGVRYTDAACTAVVGMTYVDAGCPSPVPDYFGEIDYATCEAEVQHLYRRGDLVSPAATYERLADGSCDGPRPPDGTMQFYSVDEVSRDELAPLALSAAGPARYEQRFLESADGARMFGTVDDTVLGASCFLSTRDVDATRCEPYAAFANFHYSDAACSVPATAQPVTCPDPAYLVKYPYGTACPLDPPRFFDAGDAVTSIYRTSGASCIAEVPDPAMKYFETADEIELPMLPRTVDAVDGRRIQLSHATTTDGRLRIVGQRDTVLDTACFPLADAEGTLRCYPSPASGIGTFYTDAACTSPIALAEAIDVGPTCDPLAPINFAYRSVGQCTSTIELYRLGAAYAGPLYVDDGACSAAPAAEYHTVGAPIPATELASGVVVVDP